MALLAVALFPISAGTVSLDKTLLTFQQGLNMPPKLHTADPSVFFTEQYLEFPKNRFPSGSHSSMLSLLLPPL